MQSINGANNLIQKIINRKKIFYYRLSLKDISQTLIIRKITLTQV